MHAQATSGTATGTLKEMRVRGLHFSMRMPVDRVRDRGARFGLVAAIAEVEAALVDTLALDPVEIPPSFASARGVIRKTAVAWEARVYAGDGASLLRVVTITGGPIEIVDLLLVPRASSGAPILAIELDARGANRAYVGADLAPMVDEPAILVAQSRELARRRPHLAAAEAWSGLQPLGELPGWRRVWASGRPMHAHVDAVHAALVRRATAAYAGTYCALARDPFVTASPDVLHRHAAYIRERRHRDPVCALVEHAFGTIASDLVARVLFPRRW